MLWETKKRKHILYAKEETMFGGTYGILRKIS